jgi:sarcosine oxidase
MFRRDFLKALAAGAAIAQMGKAAQKGADTKPMSTNQTSNASARKSYDVAVIGAGVFGSWTAHALSRAVKKVVLLDAYGAANSRASSGGESRIIRMGYGPDELYSRWAMHSLPRWQQLFERAGVNLFQPTGVLWMAQENDRYANETAATLSRLEADFEKLPLPDLEKRYPQISFEGVSWGILERRSGVLLARRAVQVVLGEAQQNGVDFLLEAVAAPDGKGHLDTVKTASGKVISAGSFVFACGPWLPKVFPDVVGDRIFPTRQEVFFFGVPPGDPRFEPPAMPTWIHLASEIYGMPDLESRGVKIASDRHGPAADPDTQQRMASAEGLQAARDYLGKRFPALKDAPVLESRVCQYENTSSGDFLIDRHPAFDNVWLVGGGSGHGFKHGPALGEYVAAQVGSAGKPEPRFSLATKKAAQKREVY